MISRIPFLNAVYIAGLLLCGASVAFAFTSSEEYLSHSQGISSCVTEGCHSTLSDKKLRHAHAPVSSGDCSSCHRADAYPNKFGIDTDQRALCAACHPLLEKTVQSSRFVHGPIRNGDCISCHDPHGSDEQFMLRMSHTELCSNCHKLKRLYSGSSVHQPVADGNCSICHDPHASNNRSRLTESGANLCISCHDDMVTGMTMTHVHEPLVQTGCTDCHDPHSGTDLLRLRTSGQDLCFRCHKEKQEEVGHYTNKHEPAEKGHCTACHSPHFSTGPSLLRDRTDRLCYTCHEESREWKERRFQHGPVVQGNCPACHNPHGSDNPYILRLAFPHRFYAPYEKGEYALCFLCHKEALVTVERTRNATSFRNGETNLHWLHVNQKKGRTCRACHDVHASNQEGRIRDEFPYGTTTIPLEFFKTQNGGRCIPGCHVERGYDRVQEVVNSK